MSVNTFLNITQIYQNASKLKPLQQIFIHLDSLNQILKNNLPKHLVAICHVGAFDDSTVVVYVNNQQALHILQSMSNAILQSFYMANYSFDNLLIRVRVSNNYKAPKKITNIKKLDPTIKTGLLKLANLIGKPELLTEYTADSEPHNDDDVTDDEIKF
ncbi:MAG: hypothetical protein QG673_1312 [Pseudomonadota bacterium]|nr:hypothetical protein [Pseudomonadota bacterium]